MNTLFFTITKFKPGSSFGHQPKGLLFGVQNRFSLENRLIWINTFFVFTVKNKIKIDGINEWRQTRIGNERSAWVKLCEKAGTPGLQIKDLRKYWNSYLVNYCGLSHKEAGLHIGNSNMVNYNHYTQVDYDAIRAKLEKNHDLSPQFLN